MDKELLARAEKLLWKFRCDSDAAHVRLKSSVGEKTTRETLQKFAEAYRLWYAFAAALSDATGRGAYRSRWDFQERLTDREKSLWLGMRHNGMPTVELPAEAVKLLDDLRAEFAKPEPVVVLRPEGQLSPGAQFRASLAKKFSSHEVKR